MRSELFRKKSMERLSSPEQLNDYIRVVSPADWMVLAAVALLLVGVCVWGVFGRLDTVLQVGSMEQDGRLVCYVGEADIAGVAEGMPVEIGRAVFTVDSIAVQPVQVDESFAEYLKHTGGLADGEWVYALTLDGTLGEEGGIYPARIIIERVSPVSFVLP